MRFLGIDPGCRTVGIGVVEQLPTGALKALDWCVIKTTANDTALQLLEIQDDFSSLLETHSPTLAVVERVYFARNEKTAIDVAQARGVLLLALASRGIPIIEPSPPQIKAAITGDGKADKKQIQAMVARTLALPSLPSPVDAADALAMAIYGALSARTMPALR